MSDAIQAKALRAARWLDSGGYLLKLGITSTGWYDEDLAFDYDDEELVELAIREGWKDSVSLDSPEFTNDPVAKANAESWPSGPKRRKR